MGSRSTISNDLAYIAGFLDGDGSLMFQIKKRKDGKLGWRFMVTICFYQDSRHDKPLYWIRKKLRIGYISKRNDNITELRINGYEQIRNILTNLFIHIRFKKKQAKALLKAIYILIHHSVNKLTKRERMVLARCMWIVQSENYITKQKKSLKDIKQILGLTP